MTITESNLLEKIQRLKENKSKYDKITDDLEKLLKEICCNISWDWHTSVCINVDERLKLYRNELAKIRGE